MAVIIILSISICYIIFINLCIGLGVLGIVVLLNIQLESCLLLDSEEEKKFELSYKLR